MFLDIGQIDDPLNTCPQNVFLFCSHFYDPPIVGEPASQLYENYGDCVSVKTPNQCGHPFDPTKWSGWKVNPYTNQVNDGKAAQNTEEPILLPALDNKRIYVIVVAVFLILAILYKK